MSHQSIGKMSLYQIPTKLAQTNPRKGPFLMNPSKLINPKIKNQTFPNNSKNIPHGYPNIPNLDSSITHKVLDVNDFTIIHKQTKTGIYKDSFLVQNKKTNISYIAKTINDSNNPKCQLSMIMQIFNIMIIKDPTINIFLGYSKKDFQGGDNLTIFTEYNENGSLSDVFEKNQLSHFNNTQKQKIMIGIARSMMILYDKYKIIHGRLKPSNILIGKNNQPLLTDFGLTKIFKECSNKFPVIDDNDSVYMAPEIIECNYYSIFADVYSFGVIIYQIVTGNRPSHGEIKFDNIINVGLKNLIKNCLSKNPLSRPTFSELYQTLVESLECRLSDVDNDELNLYVKEISKDLAIISPSIQKNENCEGIDSFDQNINKIDLQLKPKNDDHILKTVDSNSKPKYDKKIMKKFINTKPKPKIDKIKIAVDSQLQDDQKKKTIDTKSMPKIDRIKKTIDSQLKQHNLHQTHYKAIDPNKEIICISCNKKIENDEAYYYSCFPYHKDCLKCSICQKKIESLHKKDFVCVTPGMFFCKEDYNKYLQTKTLPTEILNEYRDKMVKNGLIEAFKPLFSNGFIKYISEEYDIIEPDIIENSFQLNKYYEYFIPTVTFHFELPPNRINLNRFIEEILPKEMIIVDIKKGSTFLTLAFILSEDYIVFENRYHEIVESLKPVLNSGIGKSIVGNLLDEPKIKIPNNNDIKEFYSKKIINFLQKTEILEDIDLEEIKRYVYREIYAKRNKNIKFIYDHYNLFNDAEENIREDIESSEIELVLTGMTIIASKYFNENERIKYKIARHNKDTLCDVFLYHGTDLEKHPNIITQHFLDPEENPNKNDDGNYGKGIYLTDKIYYASMYNKKFHYLVNNEKSSVLCCRAIYNSKYAKDLNEYDADTFKFKPIEDEIKNNFGVYYVLVGNNQYNMNFISEITVNQIDQLYLSATEFVFGNKFQIVPVCSFTVMKTDFFILWINGDDEKYKNYSNELRQKIVENVYFIGLDNFEELIEKKKRNKMKLILSFDNFELGSNMLECIRERLNLKFICIVFSEDKEQLSFANEFENVIFTDDVLDLIEFASLDLGENDYILDFIKKLENKYKTQFKINSKDVLCFDYLNKFQKGKF